MAVREITLWPHRNLLAIAKPAKLDEHAASALEDLEDTMLAARGLGLAATQVHDTWRDGFPPALIVVVEDTRPAREVQGYSIPEKSMRFWKLANPKIVARGEEKLMRREGCLSIPDYYERVERHWSVDVEADELHDDKTWERITLKATGVLAHALQHEIEHLDGGFFITELGSQLKIDLAKKYAAKRWGRRNVRTYRPGQPTADEQAKMLKEAKARASARTSLRRGLRR